ncbi:MAG: hypothetical protein P4M04_07100 [Acidobacteriota bacterium]|nr:hypothetical protein [Acidobacteriota bacterium]
MTASIAHKQLRADQAIAADDTLLTANRLDGRQTFGTDRNAGNVVEGSIAKPAIGREEDRKKTAQKGL